MVPVLLNLEYKKDEFYSIILIKLMDIVILEKQIISNVEKESINHKLIIRVASIIMHCGPLRYDNMDMIILILKY